MYSPKQQQILKQIARASIEYGLLHGQALSPKLASLDEALTQQRASFVTLNLHTALRGCIGSLIARRPLAEDVAQNAFAAAFHDPRFPPVNETEIEALELHISVLSAPEPINCNSEQDLLNQLKPNIDGLIIKEGHHQATFLPSVWEQLPRREQFLKHLKTKAGLATDHWSDQIQCFRYFTETF
jgi:hypothetical protein